MEQPSPTFCNLPSEKQGRIMEGALDEFADKGYGKASLNSLVAGLGISKGSIFQYFKDKSGLFNLVFDYAVGKVKDHLKQVRAQTKGMPVAERIRLSLVCGLELLESNPRLFQLYLRIVFEGDVPFRGRLLQSIRIFSRDYLLDLLKDGQAAGEVRRDLDLAATAFMLDAVLERILVARTVAHMDPELGLSQGDRKRAEELAGQVIDTIMKGIGS